MDLARIGQKQFLLSNEMRRIVGEMKLVDFLQNYKEAWLSQQSDELHDPNLSDFVDKFYLQDIVNHLHGIVLENFDPSSFFAISYPTYDLPKQKSYAMPSSLSQVSRYHFLSLDSY